MLPVTRPKILLATLCVALGGCDMLGLPNPAKEAAQAEAEGKAVGAACRHSGRSLEDCYALYPDQSRALVFAGWREMQDYMASGNLTAVPPTIEREPPKRESEQAEEDEEPARKRSSRKRSEDDEDEPNGKRSRSEESSSRQAKTDAH